MTNPKPKKSQAKTGKRFVLRLNLQTTELQRKSDVKAFFQVLLDIALRRDARGLKSARVVGVDLP